MPKTQGISARETCPDDILVVLQNSEMGFENLAEKLATDYARATVSKYLTELYEKSPFVQRKGRRGNYYLTEKGRKKAKTKQFVKQISEISDEFTEQFILNYKDYVMNRIKSSLFFPYKISSISKIVPILPPEYRKDWIQLQQSLLKMKIRPNSEIDRLAQALETDLTKHGFSDEEILKLWIIGNGYFMERAVKAYGAPNFFNALPFKFPPIVLSWKKDENNPELHRKRIREAIKKYDPIDIQKEISLFDLFP